MITYTNLYKEVFSSNIPATQFNIVSGYIGPSVIEKLASLPYESNVYVGMYGTHMDPILHKQLQILSQNDRVNIFYTKELIHSKCYVWINIDEVVKALVGSANFSTNGLYVDNKEILCDINKSDFTALQNYIEYIQANSISVLDVDVSELVKSDYIIEGDSLVYNGVETVDLSLLATRNGGMNIIGIQTNKGEVPTGSGLNWGYSNALPSPSDAYLAIQQEKIVNFPAIFPPKGLHNIPFDVIWDDGEHMQMLFEGSQPINGIMYPKQISSFNDKSILGKYMRKRIGDRIGADLTLPNINKKIFCEHKNDYKDKLITKKMLVMYGKTYIIVRKLQESTYFFDFSPN